MIQLARHLLLALGITVVGLACGPSDEPSQGATPIAATPTVTPRILASPTPGPTATPIVTPGGSSTVTLKPGISKNKDGQMAKVSSGLASLYEEYQAYVQEKGSGEGFKPSNPLLPVVGSQVVIDAVASEDANTLKDDLEALGLQAGAVYGSMVSGRLPVAAIGSVARLDSLKFARPAYSTTRGGSS